MRGICCRIKLTTQCTVWTHLDPGVQSIDCPLCPRLQLILQVFVVKIYSCKDVFFLLTSLGAEGHLFTFSEPLSAWPHYPATSAFMWLHPRLVGVVLGGSLLLGSRRQRYHPLFSYIPFPRRNQEKEKNQYLSYTPFLLSTIPLTRKWWVSLLLPYVLIFGGNRMTAAVGRGVFFLHYRRVLWDESSMLGFWYSHGEMKEYGMFFLMITIFPPIQS